ncbi:MAG: hypothetical protein KTV16_11820, partial [Acidimicrobiia bacterium]|nr:hypothetical protein [Acidimicrobiia bacterium]
MEQRGLNLAIDRIAPTWIGFFLKFLLTCENWCNILKICVYILPKICIVVSCLFRGDRSVNPPERTSAMRRFVVPLLAVVLFGSLLGVPSAAAQAQVPEPLPEPLEIGDQAVGGGGDSERPKVVSLEVVSSPADGWRSAYGEGESVQFGVTFSE